MIVNYKSDGSMESILDLIGKSSSNKISGETFTEAVKLRNLYKNLQVPADLGKWGEELTNVDGSFKTLVADMASGKKSVEDLDVYIKKANMSTGTFAAGIKSIGANIGIMLAVTLAIKGVMYAWDEMNVTVEEMKGKYDELTSSLQTFQSEYDTLNSKDYDSLSDSEKERLEYLKVRIEREKELLKIQQEKINEEKYGTKFTDNFDKDSYAYKTSQEDQYATSDWRSDLTHNTGTDISKALDDYNKLQAKASSVDNELKITNKESELQNYLTNAQEELTNLENTYDDIQSDIDSGTLTKTQQKKAEGYLDDYSNRIANVSNNINLIQNALHTLPETIDALAQKTNLSADELKSNFSPDEMQVLLTTKFDKNTSLDDLKKIIAEMQKEADDKPVEIDVATRISDLSKVKDDLSKVQDIFEDIKDGGSFDLSLLADDNFTTAFSGYTKEYQNFLNVMTDGNSTIEQQKTALNGLVSIYLSDSKALSNLSDNEKSYVVEMLKESGVANAQEIVNHKLAQSKVDNMLATIDLSKSVEENAEIMRDELSVYDLTETEIGELSTAYANAQGYMNEVLSIGVSDRMKILQSELEGIQSVADAYNILAGKYESATGDSSSEVQRNINTNMQLDNDYGKQAKAIINFGATKQKIAEILAKTQTTFNGIPSAPSSGGSGSDKSKTDPYKAEIDALKDYTDAYEAAQAKREAIGKKYDNATTNEEKLALAQARIDAMNNEQKAIEDLNTARDKEIQKKVSQLQGQGFKVSYDATADNLHISNMEHLNELKGKDQELTNDLIQEYENIIKDTQDMADANKDLSVTWQDNVYSIRGYSDEIKKLKQEIVSEKISNAEFLIDMLSESDGKESQIISLYQNIATEANNALKEALSQGLDYTDEWVQTILSKLNDVGSKIKAIKVQLAQDEVDKNNSILAGISAIVNDKIDALNEEKEALEKLNDEQDRAIKLSQLKKALDLAENQKTIYTYRKNTGWGYEVDQDAISKAKQEMSEYNNEQEIKAIEDEIQSWQDYLDKWNDIPSEYEKAQNILIAKQEFGRNIEKKILDQRIDIIDDFKDRYEGSMKDLKEIQDTSIDDMLKKLGVLENIQAAMSTSKGKHYYANANGTSPSGATVGDYVHTNAGTYKIVVAGTEGASYNPETKLWSIKVDNVNASITDAIAGTEILTDTLSNNNSNLSTVSSGLDSNSYSNDDNTDATEDNTDSNKELSENIDSLSSQLKNGITVNGTNSSSGNSGSLSDINLSEDGFKAGLEILKKTVGEDSQMYKDAVKYYNNLYPNSNSSSSASELPVIGSMDSVAKSKSVAESSSYDEYFSSFNTTKLANGFYEFLDDAGRTVSATEDWFKTNYVLNNPDGYTDRERASSILSKAEETGYLETLMKYYPEFTKRQYDIDNTEVGGDLMVTQAARESAQRIYDEILNDVGSSVGGSYDSSGKKVISYSYDRNGDLVDTGYSKNALDFSDLDITVAPSDKDIYESPIYKAVKEAYLSSPDYEGDKGTNPDTVRAYDSSANNVYDSLKLETQKNGEETKSNSERLYENSQALQSLGEEFGDGIYDLVDAANGVVKVIDTQNGNIVGAINTKNGSVYRNGSSSSGGSSGGLYSSDGTYGTYYSKEDQEAILQYQNDYNKAIAEGNQSAADAAHQAANEIRKLYNDIADEAGKIINSSNDSKSYTSSGKTVTVSNNGKTVTVTSAHARGIRRVKKDELSALGEEGQELLINNPYGGVATLVGEGSTVFNADATSEAYDFLNDPQTYIGDILKNIDLSNFSIGNDLFSGLTKVSTPIIPTTNNSSSVVNNIKAEFPNATNADEIKKALESIGTINNLPQLSTQRGYSNLI